MSKTMTNCPPTPCNTCPYRRDTPPGIWSPSEYIRLVEYDSDGLELATFHCHQERVTGTPTICRGWVSCHQFGSVAIRMAVLAGILTTEQVLAPCSVPLYESGREAALAGLEGVHQPSKKAMQAAEKLLKLSPHFKMG